VKQRDHYGNAMVEVSRFNREITLDEFRKAVAKKEGLAGREYMIDAANVIGKTALYRATVRSPQTDHERLYLLNPRSDHGKKYYSLDRRDIDDEGEASLVDLWEVQRKAREGFRRTLI